jgi:hypothetical protein
MVVGGMRGEGAMIGVFEMLIERLGNLEAAVAAQGRMLQEAADERTGTRIRPAALGSSLRGFTVRKMYEGVIGDLLVLDISLAEGMHVFETEEWASGKERSWMDAGADRAFGREVADSVRARCLELLPAAREIGARLRCADVGLTGTPHDFVYRAWLEVGLKGIAPSVMAVGPEHVVFRIKSLREALDVVHQARHLLQSDPMPDDHLIQAYCTPWQLHELAIAYVVAAERKTALRDAWAALKPMHRTMASWWLEEGPPSQYDFFDRTAVAELI